MVMKENEDELSLFLEMRRCEKEKERNLVNLHNDDSQLDAPPGSKPEVFLKTNFVPSVPARRTRMDEFLNSENDKNDYDWLLTPPGTPLFHSLEMESQKSAVSRMEDSTARPTALKSRLSNLQVEPTTTSTTTTKGNVASKQPTFLSGLNSSGVGSRRPSSSGGPTPATSRPATPTGRPTLPATIKSSRASAPTSRATLTSTKPTAPPARSSTPSRSTARSSTPTARPSVPASKSASRSSTPTARPSVPASKSTSRSSTPTRQSSIPSNASRISAPLGRSSSVTKSSSTISKTPVPSRGSSPTVKSRPWKPSELPGFSNEAPLNLKTSLPARPSSASRGRPGAASAQSSSVEAGSKGKVRQQSCSPSRGRASGVNAYKSGSSVPRMSRAHSNDSDNVNPGLMGTQMVERVVNMRKLAPPKQDGYRSMNNNPVGKSSSGTDSSGFGLSLSKKSLDMAMRHMDIRRSISSSGSLRPLMTNIPASSLYSVRSGSGPTKSKPTRVSDSPIATSSNASSELSVSMCLDVSDREENDLGSERRSSFTGIQHGR